MKLLIEHQESNQVQLVTEGAGDSKTLFIEGVFAQAEKKNRNGRIYPKSIMEAAVNKYNTEYVHTRRALGELSHPDSRPTVKPELASHLTTSLVFEGNDVMGRAKVLNTPQGSVLRGLLEGGVQMGVSTRGLGSIYEQNGTTYVKSDFAMMAIDAVSDPSAIDAWINPLYESLNYEMLQDGRIVELIIDAKKAKINEAVMIKEFTKYLTQLQKN